MAGKVTYGTCDHAKNPKNLESSEGNWGFRGVSWLTSPFSYVGKVAFGGVKSLVKIPFTLFTCCVTKLSEPDYPSEYWGHGKRVSFEFTRPLTKSTVQSEIESAGYAFGKKLGEGGWGEVHLAYKGGKKYAIKTIDPEDAVDDKYFAGRGVRGEALALSFPKHEHLIQTDGIFTYDMANGSYRYVTDRETCRDTEYVVGIVMEYFENSEELSERYSLNEEEMKTVGYQLACGIAELHRQGYMHRDIKDENVLIHDTDNTIKLVDFGFARYLPKDERRTTTFCGSPLYIAPEIIKGRGYDFKADSWSYGVLLWRLAAGEDPFLVGGSKGAIMEKIRNYRDPSELDQCGATLFHDSDFMDLVSGCLEADPAKRFTMEQVREHAFFTVKKS